MCVGKNFDFYQNNSAYFDMAGYVYKGKSASGFRLGDRAAVYIYLLDWRHSNLSSKLVVFENLGRPGVPTEFEAEWLFAGLADEIWTSRTVDSEGCSRGWPSISPGWRPLYTRSMWSIWRGLRTRWRELPHPSIKLKTESLQRADWYLKAHQVPSGYVTMQPLYDAQYNRYRNFPIEWWYALYTRLTREGISVVVLDKPNSLFLQAYGKHIRFYSTCSVMTNLALVRSSKAHIGGETGLTLWAAILGVPIMAVYKFWGIMNRMDYRPIPFGAPIEPCKLSADVPGSSLDFTVHKVKELMFKTAGM
jgi:hypothetical protein